MLQGPLYETLTRKINRPRNVSYLTCGDNIYKYRLTPMPRTLLISITLMSIWLKFGETVTQKVGKMILRSYPGTS